MRGARRVPKRQGKVMVRMAKERAKEKEREKVSLVTRYLPLRVRGRARVGKARGKKEEEEWARAKDGVDALGQYETSTFPNMWCVSIILGLVCEEGLVWSVLNQRLLIYLLTFQILAVKRGF